MVAKGKNKPLTPVELEIMKVLWEAGSATVQHVRSQMPGQHKPAYTTVQTMLNVLYRKGKVKRVLKGKSYEYSPAQSKEGAIGQAIRDILDRLFAGSVDDLVMALIRDRHLTPQKLVELKRLIDRSQSGKENLSERG